MDQFLVKVFIDLFAQVVDIYVHYIRAHIEIHAPYVFQYIHAREHPALVAQQVLHKAKLGSRKLDRCSCPRYGFGILVELQVGQPQHFVTLKIGIAVEAPAE